LLPGHAIPLNLPASARDFALVYPGGVAPGDGNGFFVADRDRHQLFVVDASDMIRLVAGTGAPGSGAANVAAPPAPADQAALRYPNVLRRDGQGKLYFLDDAYGDGNAIRVVTPAGGSWTITTLVAGTSKERVGELVAAADGTVWYGTDLGKLYKVTAGAQPTLVGTLPGGAVGLALAPDGTLYASLGPQQGPNPGGRLAIFAPGSSTPRVVTSAKLSTWGHDLACDPKGRLFLTDSIGNSVSRYDPGTDTLTVVAGKGGTQFSGDGVDDGVKFPTYPCFNAAGDLLFVDTDHHQVKRIAAGAL
jgi:sugar lactone lactonase YvrE